MSEFRTRERKKRETCRSKNNCYSTICNDTTTGLSDATWVSNRLPRTAKFTELSTSL